MTATTRHRSEGTSAHRKGIKRGECPYTRADLKTAWQAGWDEAEAQVVARAESAKVPRWVDATNRTQDHRDKPENAWRLQGDAPHIHVFQREHDQQWVAECVDQGISYIRLGLPTTCSRGRVQSAALLAVTKVLKTRYDRAVAIADVEGNLLTDRRE
jgi:ribosome modulation factor